MLPVDIGHSIQANPLSMQKPPASTDLHGYIPLVSDLLKKIDFGFLLVYSENKFDLHYKG